MSDIYKEKNNFLKIFLITIACILALSGLVFCGLLFKTEVVVATPTFTNYTVTTSAPVSGQGTVNATISDPIFDNQYIMVWDKNVPAPEKADAIDALADFSIVENIDAEFLVVRYNGSSLTSEEIIALLSGISGVQLVEPNYIVEIESISNDTYADAQWALETNGFYKYYDAFPPTITQTQIIKPDIDINYLAASLLYEATVENPREVVVAVIDTGVDINHEDLAANIWINPGEIPGDGIDNDGNGYIDDVNGWDFYNNDNTLVHYEKSPDGKYTDSDDHGTHVAGIIAAVSNNETGIAGAASFIPIKIMPIKINGGARSSGTVSAAIKAINYATAMGADICNMSWGSTGLANSLNSIRIAMESSDMLFVCAAGNEGRNNDETPMYPASLNLSNSISVAYLDQFGKLVPQKEVVTATGTYYSGSNYGVTSVDVAAPGVYIVSTLTENRYGATSGSSVATPLVTAIAAVLYSTNDGLYPAEIKELILSTLKTTAYNEDGTETPMDLSDLEGKVANVGIPDMFAALKEASSLQQDSEKPFLSIERTFEGEIIILSVTATDDLSGVRVVKYSKAASEKDLKNDAYFLRGTIGTDYTAPLRLAKGGYYAFYISDSAGNDQVIHYYLEDDTTAPEIELLTTTISPSGVTLAVLDVSEYESGLSKFLLMAGERTAAEFLAEDAETQSLTATDGRLLLRLGEENVYTLYASDYRGNVSVYVIRKTEE